MRSCRSWSSDFGWGDDDDEGEDERLSSAGRRRRRVVESVLEGTFGGGGMAGRGGADVGVWGRSSVSERKTPESRSRGLEGLWVWVWGEGIEERKEGGLV